MPQQLHKMNCNYFAGQALNIVNETANQGHRTNQHGGKSFKAVKKC